MQMDLPVERPALRAPDDMHMAGPEVAEVMPASREAAVAFSGRSYAAYNCRFARRVASRGTWASEDDKKRLSAMQKREPPRQPTRFYMHDLPRTT